MKSESSNKYKSQQKKSIQMIKTTEVKLVFQKLKEILGFQSILWSQAAPLVVIWAELTTLSLL